MNTQQEENVPRKKQLQRLNELLEENNMTRSALAQLLGINKSTITRWFDGKIGSIKATYLDRLSNYFNVNPWWLLGYETTKEKENEHHKLLRDEIYDVLSTLSDSQLDDVKKYIDTFIKKRY